MMILVPGMWIKTMHQDLDDDDIDEYGKLVIDLPDQSCNSNGSPESDAIEGNIVVNTELKGDDTSKPEKQKPWPEPDVTKPTEDNFLTVSPRSFRDIPIKLLLKRSFQNRNKQHEKRQKLDLMDDWENNSIESLPNSNETSPSHEQNTKEIEIKETTATDKLEINNKKDNSHSVLNNETTFEKPIIVDEALGTKNLKEVLLSPNYPNRLEKQNLTPNVTNIEEINERISPHNYIDVTGPNERNSCIKCFKKKLISTHRYNTNNVQQTSVIKNSYAYDSKTIENSKNNTKEMRPDSNMRQNQHQNRISVVSNDFLFRHQNKLETHSNSYETMSQSYMHRKENEERISSHRFYETSTDFTKQKYSIVDDNIPTTVHRSNLQQELLKPPIANVNRITSNPQKLRSRDNNPNARLEPQNTGTFAAQSTPNVEINPGYNILVHRGPDINRIVITIADESENKKTNNHPHYTDQRVPDKEPPPEVIKPKKRSYYYKEPSLRSFRRRSPQSGVQKQRNTYKNKIQQLHQTDERIQTFAPNYNSLANYRFSPPAPSVDHYYSLVGQNSVNNARPAFRPWDIRDRIVQPDPLARSSPTKVPSSQKYIDSHEQMPYSPMDLSLKTLTVKDTSYPRIHEMHPNYQL